MSEEMSSRFCKTCKCIMPLTDNQCDFCSRSKNHECLTHNLKFKSAYQYHLHIINEHDPRLQDNSNVS